MNDLPRSVTFASIATLAYASLTWRHQPLLMARDAPHPLVIEPWMVACLVLAALGAFTSAWWLFLRLSKRRRPWLAGLTGGAAAAVVPILQLWLYDAVSALLFVQQSSSESARPVFAVTFGLMELILSSGLWYAVSLAAIAWFTIPLSAGIAIFFLLAEDRLLLSATRGRSGPPAPR